MKEVGASGEVDLVNKSVSIAYDEAKTSVEAIKEAIENRGYDVKP